MEGQALLSIHWMTPVESYLLRAYASNIARSPSYAITWAFIAKSSTFSPRRAACSEPR